MYVAQRPLLDEASRYQPGDIVNVEKWDAHAIRANLELGRIKFVKDELIVEPEVKAEVSAMSAISAQPQAWTCPLCSKGFKSQLALKCHSSKLHK